MEHQLLQDIVHLLQDVGWLYDFPVTQIFTRNVFSKMPEEWRDTLNELPVEVLNGIPQCNSQEHWPSSLQEFLKDCKRLSLHHLVVNPHDRQPSPDILQNVHLPQELTKGMSLKKRHEVTSLLSLVKRVSEITGSRHVLDIGSGMGYIDTLLHHVLKFTIIGAESEAENVRSANSRQWKLSGQCSGIRYLQWNLADDEVTLHKAKEVISELIHCDEICTCQIMKQNLVSGNTTDEPVLIMNKYESTASDKENDHSEATAKKATCYNENSAILLGLHACADLSPIMMKIYKECFHVSSLVLLSCCYHKMQQHNTKEQISDINLPGNKTENFCTYSFGKCESVEVTLEAENLSQKLCWQESSVNKETFDNFPMSKTLKIILEKNNIHFSTFGLRLAAQESGLRWTSQTAEDHANHTRNVAYRALLESFCIREGFSLRKRHRRVRKSHFSDLTEYIRCILVNYEFVPSKGGVCVTKHNEKESCEEFLTVVQGIGNNKRTENSDNIKKTNNSIPHTSLETSNGVELPNVTQEYITCVLKKCYEDYQHLFPLIEPLTGLQLALQPVMEALVFVDRVAYMKECGFTNIWLERVFDVEISPRNVALVALR